MLHALACNGHQFLAHALELLLELLGGRSRSASGSRRCKRKHRRRERTLHTNQRLRVGGHASTASIDARRGRDLACNCRELERIDRFVVIRRSRANTNQHHGLERERDYPRARENNVSQSARYCADIGQREYLAGSRKILLAQASQLALSKRRKELVLMLSTERQAYLIRERSDVRTDEQTPTEAYASVRVLFDCT